MLELRDLTILDEVEAKNAHAEMAEEQFDFLLGYESGDGWSDYLARLSAERLGQGLTGDRVPGTLLVADVDGHIVGRSSVRHELNPGLTLIGGHIGYGVRPAFRRRGFATEILRQSLIVLRGLGIERALVTCSEDNLGSIKTIERNGGVLNNRVQSADGSLKRRYWIP